MIFIKLSQMGSIFIEIFDIKVLNSIYPMIYISRKYGTNRNLLLFIISGNIRKKEKISNMFQKYIFRSEFATVFIASYKLAIKQVSLTKNTDHEITDIIFRSYQIKTQFLQIFVSSLNRKKRRSNFCRISSINFVDVVVYS